MKSFTMEELEEIVGQITSSKKLLDKLTAAARAGQELVAAFRCGASGMYFPADYIKEWGRLYGVGLGPHPCSESLQTEYELPPPPITPDIREIEQIMHPVGNSMAQVDLMDVPAAVYELNRLIPAKDDPHMVRRARVVRAKQLVNPRGRLRNMQAAWSREKGLQLAI